MIKIQQQIGEPLKRNSKVPAPEPVKSTKSFEDQRPESDRSVIIFRLP
jgi:hypothetical protein